MQTVVAVVDATCRRGGSSGHRGDYSGGHLILVAQKIKFEFQYIDNAAFFAAQDTISVPPTTVALGGVIPS